jgi:hypothetical protein
VGGDPVEEQELEQAELQRRPDRGLERAIDVAGDDVVQREASLDGAEGQLLGQGAIARLEAAGLAVQRAIGVGALGQRAQHYGVRGAAGGAESGERHRRPTVVRRGRTPRAARPPGRAATASPTGPKAGVGFAERFQPWDYPKGWGTRQRANTAVDCRIAAVRRSAVAPYG